MAKNKRCIGFNRTTGSTSVSAEQTEESTHNLALKDWSACARFVGVFVFDCGRLSQSAIKHGEVIGSAKKFPKHALRAACRVNWSRWWRFFLRPLRRWRRQLLLASPCRKYLRSFRPSSTLLFHPISGLPQAICTERFLRKLLTEWDCFPRGAFSSWARISSTCAGRFRRRCGVDVPSLRSPFLALRVAGCQVQAHHWCRGLCSAAVRRSRLRCKSRPAWPR